MAGLTQICPEQHLSAQGSRLCLTCGWVFPLALGSALGNYRVLEAKAFYRQWFYRVEREGHCYTVAETLEFLPEPLRDQVHIRLYKLFPEIILDYLFQNLDSLRFVYTVYPESHWALLHNSLRVQLDHKGLFSETELTPLLPQMRLLWQRLEDKDLLMPAWHPGFLALEQQQMYSLNLHLCTVDHEKYLFPQNWEGYHTPFLNMLEQPLGFNQKFARASLYSTLGEILCGLPARLWYPQRIQLQSYRFLFQSAFWQAWQAYAETMTPEHLPIARSIYTSGDGVKQISKANHLFIQGLDLCQEAQWQLAKDCFLKAQVHQLVGSQILRYLALCEQEREPQSLYFDLLSQAIRAEPLACLYRERAQGYYTDGLLVPARRDLEEAVRLAPFYPEAHFELGLCHQYLGELQKAEQAFRVAIKQRAQPRYYHQLQSLLKLQGRELERHELPAFLSTGTDRMYTTSPMLPPAFLSTCPAGHRNPIDALQCQLCGDALQKRVGEAIENYRIIEVISERQHDGEEFKGGVYVCLDSQDQKMLLKEYLVRHRSNNFQATFEPLLALRHEHLLPLERIFSQQGFAYLVFQFLEGETLQEKLERQLCLSAQECWQLLIYIASSLFYLQTQGCVHGDIKPRNIIWTADGPVLADTDSILVLERWRGFRNVVSTFPFSPPEQREKQILNHTSDLYALAVTLLYVSTGILPEYFYQFDQQRFSGWERFSLHLDSRLRKWIQQNLEPQVNDRGALGLADLQALLQQAKTDQSQQMPQQQQQMLKLMSEVKQVAVKDSIHLDKAITALLKNEASVFTYHFVAGVYRHARRWPEALGFARQALRLRKDYLRSAWLMAEIYIEQQMPKEAIQAYLLSIEYCKQFFGPYLWLARVYRSQKDFKLAVHSYRQAWERAPFLKDIPLELASLYLERQQFQVALELLDEVERTKLDYGQRAAYCQLRAAAFLGLEAYPEAIIELQEALQIRPLQVKLLFELGLACLADRRLPEAERAMYEVIENSNEHAEALYLLSQILVEQQKFSEALEKLVYLEAHTSWPREQILFQKARVLTYLGQIQVAEELYLGLAQQQPSVAVLINLGNLYLIKKEPQKARQYFLQAAQLSPENRAVRHGLQQLDKAG